MTRVVRPQMTMLKGKVALITGGSRGIGKAICLELASRGADIAFNYFRNHDAAKATEAEIAAVGVRCLRVRAHLGEPETIPELVAKVTGTLGKLDILVNNAASGVMRSSTKLDTKHWDWTLDINARAPWLCAVEAARVMPIGGRIINISSPGSTRVLPDYFAVGVSKAALEALTRYLAIELAPKQIAVNAVSASFVQTGALEAFPDSAAAKKIASRATPAGRPVTPEDIAKAVAWLCTDDAWMIRGQTILIDGGETISYR